MPPLIAIVGPTGAGKSELGIRLAGEFQGEIINCDSLQVYRYFDVGTAKLSEEQQRGIPHQLIDILDPDQPFTAGEYARRARRLLPEILGRGQIPFVVGGTGFYLRAFLDGLCAVPVGDEQLRQRLAERERRHPGVLHRMLARWDEEASHRIHPNDLVKTTRALEISILTRTRLTELHSRGRDQLEGFAVLKVGLDPPREQLYERLNLRLEQMFQSGLAEEVKHILELGFPATVKPFESLGYRQCLEWLQGELTEEDALLVAQQNTRRYAKRQMTWFRREQGVHWLCGFGTEEQILLQATDLTRNHLETCGRP